MPNNNHFVQYGLILSAFLAFLLCPAIAETNILINEIFYDPAKTGIGCYVELIGEPGASLDDYRLVGINGNGGTQYNAIDLSSNKIPSDGYFVIAENMAVPNLDLMDAKADYQNGPDNIELWFEEERADSVGYGDFGDAIFTGEKMPTLDLSGHSIGRRKDGFDTDDNSIDFVGLTVPSPGEPNWPQAAIRHSGKLSASWGKIKENKGK